MPFFNEGLMPKAHNEYVCWLDIMGTKNKMDNSVRTCATFIFKLHSAVLECINERIDITTYPVMDGVYLTSKKKNDIETFLTNVLIKLANMFIEERKNDYKFLLKASLAYGPIIHGKDIPDEANRQFTEFPGYKSSILIGLPMIQAITHEKDAPPFGIYIHESARSFCPDNDEPFGHKWWKWFIKQNREWDKNKSQRLMENVKAYFDYATNNSLILDYPKDKIDLHRKMFIEYMVGKTV